MFFCFKQLIEPFDLISEKNFTELVELLHVPLQTLYSFGSANGREIYGNIENIENGHNNKI